jgi:hypothetical protein
MMNFLPVEQDACPLRGLAAADNRDQLQREFDLEMNQYNRVPPWEVDSLPDSHRDPLVFWRTVMQTSKFPILLRLVKKVLGLPAASAASERLFSYTGQRVGKLMANMGDEALLRWTLIRAIKRFFQKWGIQSR